MNTGPSISAAHRMAAADSQAGRAETLGDVDYLKERTEQIGAATDFKANAAVVRTADEMAGALLNLKV